MELPYLTQCVISGSYFVNVPSVGTRTRRELGFWPASPLVYKRWKNPSKVPLCPTFLGLRHSSGRDGSLGKALQQREIGREVSAAGPSPSPNGTRNPGNGTSTDVSLSVPALLRFAPDAPSRHGQRGSAVASWSASTWNREDRNRAANPITSESGYKQVCRRPGHTKARSRQGRESGEETKTEVIQAISTVRQRPLAGS